MKREFKNPALILFLIMLFSLSALAQPMSGPGNRGMGPMKMMEKLNLTPEQEKQMQDLRFKHEAKMIDLRADLQTERLDLRKLMSAEEPNVKKIHGQIEKVGVVEVNIEKARFDQRLAVRNILTEEQRKLFRDGARNCDGPFGNGPCGNGPGEHKMMGDKQGRFRRP